MKIIYNNNTLSEADNMQDLSFNLIYNRINFFLNKPNFKSNVLIPDTLRSYNELMSCFKESNCIEKFDNYLNYRITSEFNNDKIIFFRQLASSSDELLIILVLNYFSEYTYPYERSEIDSELFNAKNYYNISITDIVSAFNYIEENAQNETSNNKRFVEFLKVYTSFRILKSNVFFRSNLLLGGLINDYHIIFPKQQKDDARRDQIIFNYKAVIELNPKFEIWLNYFITSIGVLKADFRLDDENIFERRRLTRVYETAYFSPIFPIVSLFCLNDKLQSDSDKLIEECILWAKKNENIKDLFCNPLFVNEFNRKLDNYAKHNVKETLGKYSEIVFEYIFKGIPYVISDLKQKYPSLKFLESNAIISNPIYSLWANNPEEYSKVIDDIYSHNHLNSYSNEIIAIAQNALDKYDKYFDKSNKNSSQGTKQAMNFLVKLFEKDKDIHKEFKKFRSQMDRQYNNGLNNIHNLLNRIANG